MWFAVFEYNLYVQYNRIIITIELWRFYAAQIFKSFKRDHVSQYFQELYWLPVNKRIMFKMLLYVFKAQIYLKIDMGLYISLLLYRI